MRFSFIDRDHGSLPRARLCALFGVTDRGPRAWRDRPPSRHQRDDMVLLAHIREQHRLSLGSDGRPRMTSELRELGFDIGHRRVARLMRDNAIHAVRTGKDKRTTDSAHDLNVAPNLLDRDFEAAAPNEKWGEPMERRRPSGLNQWRLDGQLQETLANDISVAIVARTDGAFSATRTSEG